MKSAQKITFIHAVQYLFILGLTILPLQQFILRPLQAAGIHPGLLVILTYWQGLPLLFLGFAALFLIVKKTDRPPLDVLYLALLGFVVIQTAVRWNVLDEQLIGIRYGVLAMLAYAIGRTHLPQPFLDRSLRWAFWLTVAVAIMQLMLWISGNQSFAELIKLNSHFQAGSWPRLYGSLPGPNQLASFLVISTLYLYWTRLISLTELIVAALVVLLTFSRSAWLAMAAGLFLPAIYQAKTIMKFKMAGLAVLAVILVGLSLYSISPIRTAVIEARHSDERFTALEDARSRIADSTLLQIVCGHGAGTSGPAAFALNRGFIPENWFIQIFYEYGLIGFGLIAGLLLGAAFYGLKTGQWWLTAITSAAVVNSLFLHPLSDNMPMALWLYLLIGTAVRPKLETAQVKR